MVGLFFDQLWLNEDPWKIGLDGTDEYRLVVGEKIQSLVYSILLDLEQSENQWDVV